MAQASWVWVVAVLAVGFPLVGCGADSDDKSDTSGPTSWHGGSAHFVAKGKLNGETVTVSITGDAALDPQNLWCEREYVVPLVAGAPDYAAGKLVEIRVDGFTEVAGARRRFEVEFKKHDFQSDAPGTTVTVVPRDDLVDPGPTQMWFEWEWYDAADVELLEAAATEGSSKLELYSGTPDSTGLVIPDGDGMAGGYLSARWSSTEEVKLSFSAQCTTSAVEQTQ